MDTLYSRHSVEIERSTMADWVGASAATLTPLVEAIRDHVFAAKRLHADAIGFRLRLAGGANGFGFAESA